jgi:hypothetical protein
MDSERSGGRIGSPSPAAASSSGSRGEPCCCGSPGRVRVPYAPYRLLRVLLGAELPGEGWEGFRVVGDRLVSDEGRAFTRGDLAWLSLTFRQAEAYRCLYKQLTRQREARNGRGDRVAGAAAAANEPRLHRCVCADRAGAHAGGGVEPESGAPVVGCHCGAQVVPGAQVCALPCVSVEAGEGEKGAAVLETLYAGRGEGSIAAALRTAPGLVITYKQVARGEGFHRGNFRGIGETEMHSGSGQAVRVAGGWGGARPMLSSYCTALPC